MSLASAAGRALALALALGASAACAQSPTTYQPSVGQPGKDVVWVPTATSLADRMLDMAQVTAKDYVIDLGSGDGRTVIAAARRGAQALGIEYNPDLVELSKRNAEKEGVSARARFVKADIFESDFSKATVVTMFLLPQINLKLRPKLLEMKPGTRIVSNSFDMGDWQADATQTVSETDGCENWCTALLWIVPAKVAGRHQTPLGELILEQEFQVVKGTLSRDGKSVPVNGKVRGEELTLDAGGRALRGRVTGGKLVLE